MKGIFNTILEVLILAVAFVVFTLLAIVGILYTFCKHVKKRDYKLEKQFRPIVRALSLAVDGFANASAGELLNDTFKVPEDNKIKYGHWYETISAICGLLKLNNQDNKLRKFVDRALCLFEKNHCENAIIEMQKEYYKINK